MRQGAWDDGATNSKTLENLGVGLDLAAGLADALHAAGRLSTRVRDAIVAGAA